MLSHHPLSLLTVFLLIASFPTLLLAQEWTPESAGRVGYGDQPVWRDEFSSNTLDSKSWVKVDEAWPHNGELQYYSPDPKYVNTNGTTLTIMATNDANGGRDYTSGRISTEGRVLFKQGLYAAKIRMPEGQGIWPAFWMFGTGPKYAEWDIAEMAGGDAALQVPPTGLGDDRSVASLWHFATLPDNATHKALVTKGNACSHRLPNGEKFSADYHVFWMEWTPTEVWVGVDRDDQQLMVLNVSQVDSFDHPMYIILNTAIGGQYPGNPDQTTVFPQRMFVDWVRVYAREGQQVVTYVTQPTEPSSTGVEPTESSSTGVQPTPSSSTGTNPSGGESSSTGDNGGNGVDDGNQFPSTSSGAGLPVIIVSGNSANTNQLSIWMVAFTFAVIAILRTF